MKAEIQTQRMQAMVMTVLCRGFWVCTISWCRSRAIRQMEKVEAKEKRRGKKVANLQRTEKEGNGQWLEETWARVVGQATNTSSRSETARLTK